MLLSCIGAVALVPALVPGTAIAFVALVPGTVVAFSLLCLYACNMPRAPREQFPGAIYHIMSRGNCKQTIFLEDFDRKDFLEILADTVAEFSWICHSYTLMKNHYHLLVETPLGNISAGMHDLNGNYARRFNWRHNRVGHLMQGRFLSPLVKDEAHLLELARYIVLNPVRADLVAEPGQWQWSSYLATAGLVPRPAFLETRLLLRQFSAYPDLARNKYIRFVADGLNNDYYRIENSRISLPIIFMGITDKDDRNRAILLAHRNHGYKVSEIADFLEVNPSTVYRAINK